MKRKLLSFVMFLAASMGLFAQGPAADVYLLYNVDHEAYLTRNGSWSTRAVMDSERGSNFYVAADPAASTFYSLTTVDIQANVFADGDGTNCWTDKSGTPDEALWSFENATNGNFYIKNKKSNSYLGCRTDGILSASAFNTEKTAWKLIKISDVKAEHNARRLGYLNTMLTAANKGTVASESELESKWVLQDVTSTVTLPGRNELWQPNDFNTGENVIHEFQKDFAEFTLPTAGLYKIDFPMMYRFGWADKCATGADQGSTFEPNIVISCNGQPYDVNSIISCASETKFSGSKEVTVDGKKVYVPDSQDGFQTSAQNGNYGNVFYVNATSDNFKVTFNFSVRIAYKGMGNWFVHNMPAGHIYRITDITPAEMEAALGGKELGFQKGEYAPYANADAMEAYTKAKNALTKAELNAAVSELNAATWTVNTKNMNAVYDGNFAQCQNNGPMIGWGMTNNTLGGNLHSRAFVLNPGENNYDNLAAFGQGDGVRSAAFIRFDGTNSDRGSQYYYGQTAPYIMPLKAGVTYKLHADVALWGDNNGNFRIYVKGPDGAEVDGLTQKTNTTTNRFDKGGGTEPLVYEFEFTPSKDGNHTLWLQCPGGDDNKHNNLITNISILGPKLDQTITWAFSELDYELNSSLTFNTATASSGLPVSYEVTAGQDCVDMTDFANGKVTFIKKGNVTITATQAGDDDTYNAAAPVAITFSVGVAKQTITWNPGFLNTTNRVGTKVTLSGATASSGLAVTYALNEGETLATLDGNVLTLLHAGNLTVKAVQAGSEDFAPAELAKTLVISKGIQTITWNQELAGRIGDQLDLTATLSSGLDAAYEVLGGGAELVDGNKLKITAADSITVKAFNNGNDDYEAATPVVKGFNAGRTLQVITWDQTFFNAHVGDYIQMKGATASSGLDVTYEVIYGDPECYEFTNDVLFIKGMGTLKVTANQAGNEVWEPAKPVIKDIFVEEGEIQEMTLEAGAYQIYNEENDAFLLRNGNWGTMAVMGEYGQTIDVAYDVDRTMYIKFLDSNMDLFEDGSGNLFCDYQASSPADSNKWRYQAAEGEGNYILINATSGKYVSIVADGDTGILKPFVTENKDDAAVLQFLKAAAIEDIHHAAKADQFAEMLEAASMDVAYDGAFDKEAMAEAFDFADVTSRVTLPASRVEAFQPNSNKNEIDNTVEVLSFDLTMPEAGLYMIEVPAMYRNATNAIMPSYIEAGMDFSATIMFTPDFTTMVCGLSDGLSATDIDYATKESDGNKPVQITVGDKSYWVPNSQDSFDAWVAAGYYTNTLFAYAAADGASVSVKATSSFGGNTWCSNWFVSNATKAQIFKMTVKENMLDSVAADDAEAIYFNIQGIQVSEPVPGQFYIKVQGDKATKVIFK